MTETLATPTRRVPEVGTGATIVRWSYRQPATVIEVILFRSGSRKGQPRMLRIQEDTVHPASGSVQDCSEQYRYERNEDGPVHEYVVNRHGWWVERGSTGLGNGLHLNHRGYYRDPHR